MVGSVWCCGQTSEGPCSELLQAGSDVPVQNSPRNIAAFGSQAYLTDSGKPWMWKFPVSQMTPVKALDHVVNYSGGLNGKDHYMVAQDDNTLWAWGSNSMGELNIQGKPSWF